MAEEKDKQLPFVAKDDEDAPEETSGYKAPEKVDLNTLQEKDKDDEALNRWKAQLLAGASSAGDDPRKVVIDSITLVVTGRADKEYPLSTHEGVEHLKKTPLVIKEGSIYRLKAKFHVNRDLVMGLKYFQVVKKGGLKVDKTDVMIGSYGPGKTHEYLFPEMEAPSGMLARGSYTVKAQFIDDDKEKHLEFEFPLHIKKEWDE